ncbi:peptidase C25 [Cloacibacterium rupense]|uniref:Peptidase C25 n=1 Tax=Cloacibacterium rupense TaxID=517423 RepID=A0ABQ2NJG4_9FLAO|nr:peptidase C25 [Cloacibacterium rupense]
MPFFKNGNYSVISGSPFFTFTQKDKEFLSLEIKNLVWEKINSKELFELNSDFIPQREVSEINTSNQPIDGFFLSNVVVSAFKKDNKGVYKLISFDIVKKSSTSKRNSFGSRTTMGDTENPLKSGTFYKIKVDKSGVFRITTKFLRDNGINPSSINPKNFRIYGNGGIMLPEFNQDPRYSALQENAIQVVGEDDGKWDDADYALFYAQGPHGYNLFDNSNGNGNKRQETRISHISQNYVNVYEDYSYYFINFDKGPGKRVQSSDIDLPSDNSNIFTSYDDYQFLNEEKINFLNIGRLWVGEPFNSAKSVSFTTNTPILASDNIKLKTSLYVQNANNDKIQINLNGQEIGNYTVSNTVDNKIREISLQTDVQNISGSTLKFDFNPTGTNPLVSYNLDYVELQYKQDLKFNNSQMNFRVFDIYEGTGDNYGFTLNNISELEQIWDVSDITNAKKVTNKSSGSEFSFGYLADSFVFNNEFVAFKASAAYEPNFVEKTENQDLSSLQNIDYLILTTKDFSSQAERIANYYRTAKNYKAEVVDVRKIYNEFSSGGQDLTALRDFARKLNTPSGSLKYILILGDTSFDFRNKTTNNKNLIPSYESDYSENFETSFVTDDYIAMTAPQNSSYIYALFPDVPIGRLPAQNIQEAKLLVDKTLSYYNAIPGQASPFGDWRMKMNFVVDDDADSRVDASSNPYMRGAFHDVMNLVIANNFEGNTNKPEYNIKKLYLDSFPAQSTAGGQRYPQVNQGITNAMSNSLYLSYFGHGGINGWSQERVLTLQEINSFNNFNNAYSRFPFVTTITCEFTLWDDHNTTSAGEQLLKLPQGGANAMITSSRAIATVYGRLFSNTFTSNFFKLNSNNDFSTIGDAFLAAKREYGTDSNHLKVNLLGDPALKLSRPKNLVIIDNIESPVTGQLRALDFIKITGHINNSGGTVDNTFNGKVVINIFDKRLNKKTLNNDGGLTPILNYSEEGSPIVKSSGTVTNGTFTIEFYMPKDINYTLGDGRILIYADNNVFDVFNNKTQKIGDINPTGINDNEAPKVQLYLNNTNFVDGGITNTNPNLLACVTDNTGINSTGSGIGHDITVILDGEVVNTTVLNDFYAPGSGNGCINSSFLDYQKGSVLYPFQNLTPGEHQLTFKVWDINNNSTTQTLNFIVKDPNTENLVIKKLLNWPNPFTNKTFVQFEHNCDDILDVNVQIFTITGKLVRTISTTVTSDPFLEGYRTNRTAIEWDGNDDFGSPVGKGTYIYKVLVRSQNQEKCKGTASLVEKLVILK